MKEALDRMGETELEPLEMILGYRFRDRRLLQQAITHSTHRQEAGPEESADNERLEFLGDSVLGLVVSQLLSNAFPAWTAGQLSQARARLVSAESLAQAARRINLGAYLRVGRGEEKTGGRDKQTLLADAYEALLAALYCDGGLAPAQRFVEATLVDESDHNDLHALSGPDHKSALQELLQARGQAPAEYRVVQESGPDHRKQFLVEVAVQGGTLATGEGGSKKKAEQQAAALALENLRKMETLG